MTHTGAEFLAAARSFEGEPYRQDPGRTDPNSGFKDCSGDVVAALAKIGQLGTPSVSSLQARWCRDNGTLRTLDEALHEAGNLLFMGPNMGYDGWGNDGHVAITIGDGRSVTEARGHAYGVLCDGALGRPWTNAARVPGLDYGHGEPPAHQPVGSPRQLSLRTPPMRGDDVTDVQTKLYGWAFITHNASINPGAHDGIYGPQTANAVRAYQSAAHLQSDGIVGPTTWASLHRI